MTNFWMVRAGAGGRLADDFRRLNVVAIGFAGKRDLTQAAHRHQIRELVSAAYPGAKPGFIPIATGTLHKFRSVMKVGDAVVTYDPSRRKYLVGEIAGDYAFRPELIPDHEQTRPVRWKGEVSRDELSRAARNTLGSTVAIFEPGETVLSEVSRLMAGGGPPTPAAAETPEISEVALDDLERIRRDVMERGHEFIKDKISELDWDELQELSAAILRAMGYKTQVSPQGGDRGKDILASPDGLGLSPPRIKVEVKHRPTTQIGAPDIRSFLGGLRGDDRGLFVSTGGFTKEAMYEAERATVPVNLVDLDLLAALLVQHYEQLDNEGRALVPLLRFYWPA
jgi:restriction system protein